MTNILKKHVLGAVGALAVTIGAAGGALAAPLFGSIPGGAVTNDALIPLFGAGTTSRNGWYGATLYLIAGAGGADIQVDYLGSEAGFNNSFLMGGFNPSTGGGTNSFNAGGFSGTTLLGVASGQLTFSFTSPLGTVNNGDANDNVAGSPNFFVSFENEDAAGGQIAYLFLDDAGADDDDNHDDMVIRLSITNGSVNVPLPAAAWLMLAGIGGLGLVARRRKSTEA